MRNTPRLSSTDCTPESSVKLSPSNSTGRRRSRHGDVVAPERLRDRVDQRVERIEVVAVDSLNLQPAAAVQRAGQADEPVRVRRHRFVDRCVVRRDDLVEQDLASW